MATIDIKDLQESVDLDRQAMRTITGGARLSGRPMRPASAPARIVDYPRGFAGRNVAEAQKPKAK